MFLSFFRKKLDDSPINGAITNNNLIDKSEIKDTIYGNYVKLILLLNEGYEYFPDIIRNIKDPEKPSTLEELNVVYEDGITVKFKY